VPIDRFQSPLRPQVLVLTSAKAGSGSGREEVPRLVQLLEAHRIECSVLHSVSEFRNRLSEQVKRLGATADGKSSRSPEPIVVAAGGDGTLSLAASLALESLAARSLAAQSLAAQSLDAQSLAGNIPMPALIPMPMGTENLVAREFGFSRSAEQVVHTIRHGAIRSIDAGKANGKLFLIMATSGFDAEVVRRLHLTRRGHIRRLSYLLPILRAIRQYSFPTLRVRVDGGEAFECAWAMVFNLPQYGGNLLIEPGAMDDDGVFDVIAFRSGSILSGLRYVAEIWGGWHLKDSTVVRLRGETVQIESEQKVPYQLDGDYAGKLPLQIEMLPRAIRLVMPVKDEQG
jgi:YegS/Rv2252/BmrU family lipid kinase